MKRLLSVIVLLTCFFNCEDRDQFKTIPVVSALSSTTGSAGQEITITGKHFSENTEEIVVLFGEIPAIVTASTSTTITVIIPENQNEVKVIVAVDKLVARNKPGFTYVAPPDIPVTNPEEDVLKPVVTSISPSSGLFGITVTIDGENFSTDKSQNLVSFNGVSAVVQDATTTKLTVTVPGSSTGPVSVTVNGNKATNEPVFTYLNTPTVTSITPASGLAGVAVTITGTNFSTDKSQNIVSFNGVAAVVQTATATQLTVTVPASSTGPVVVSVNGNTATNRPVFTYPPTVTAITPASGITGTTITITGTNFSSTNSQNIVSFNGVTAVVQTATSTRLTVVVPVSSTGPVRVTVNGIQAANEPVFTYQSLPTVTSISPTTGSEGMTITIIGTNFSTTASQNIVTFNGVPAVVKTATPTQLIVEAPASSTGPVRVNVNGNNAANEPLFTYTTMYDAVVNQILPAVGIQNTETVVEISGHHFGDDLNQIEVTISGEAAEVISVTNTKIIIRTPIDDTSGPIVVTVRNKQAEYPSNLKNVKTPTFTYYQPTCNADLILTNYILNDATAIHGPGSVRWSGQVSNIGSQPIALTYLTGGAFGSVNSIFDDADDEWCYGTVFFDLIILPGETIEIGSRVFTSCIVAGNTLFPHFDYNASDIPECNMTNNHVSVVIDW